MLVFYVISSLLACTVLLSVEASKRWGFLPKLIRRGGYTIPTTAVLYTLQVPPDSTKPALDDQTTNSSAQEQQKLFETRLMQGFAGGDYSSVYSLIRESYPEDKNMLRIAALLFLFE